MAILPLVYVLMIGATGYGVYLWAEHGRFLFHGPTGGIYGMLIRGTLYAAPLAAGLVTVVFMVKPILARPGRRAQPLALNPAAEPVLYALVREVARQIGSPLPSRIDLDCQLNASASFRRGLHGFVHQYNPWATLERPTPLTKGDLRQTICPADFRFDRVPVDVLLPIGPEPSGVAAGNAITYSRRDDQLKTKGSGAICALLVGQP